MDIAEYNYNVDDVALEDSAKQYYDKLSILGSLKVQFPDRTGNNL